MLNRRSVRQEFRDFQIAEWLQPNLRGAAAEQGAFCAEHFAFHESFVAAGKNQHHIGSFEVMVDSNLQDRGKGGVGECRIGKLVEYQYHRRTGFPFSFGYIVKGLLPCSKGRCFRRLSVEFGDGCGESTQVEQIALLQCRKKQDSLIFDELLDKGGFAYSPTPIQYDHFKTATVV